MSNINIQQLQAIKAAIKQSIIDKGVTVGDDFTTYANAISQIESGGGSEDKSGALGRYLQYCLDNPETITSSSFYEEYKYLTTTLLLGKQYDLTSNSTSPSSGFKNMFYSNKNINCVDIKLIGTHRGDYSFMFSGCTGLTSANVDFNNRVEYIYNSSLGTHSYAVFNGCTSLLYCNALNFNGDSLEEFFRGCTRLRSATLTNVKSSGLRNINILGTFYNCPALVRIDGINFDTVLEIPNSSGSGNYAFYSTNTKTSTMFNNPKLRFMRIRNLGKNDGESGRNYGFNFNSAQYQYWGIENTNEPLSKDARQSLIDTLITYSYDRVNAGYTETCTISLYSTTMALLTDVEIAQITSKGFTLA